jgi:hypothetical protein
MNLKIGKTRFGIIAIGYRLTLLRTMRLVNSLIMCEKRNFLK